jgi:cysteinyl-tRNA synthetase
MSMDLLGEGFDIHGGGADLAFPHHENEIAQSEAATGRPFAKYWIHNGFVNISSEKMSKSLGNVLNIRDILKTVHPEALRLFLISSHYRSPLDYSETSIKESASALERLYAAMASLDEVIGRGGTSTDLPDELTGISNRFWRPWTTTLSPRPWLFCLTRAINRYSAAASLSEIPSPDVLTKVKNEIGALSREVLGLLKEEPALFLENLRKGGVTDLESVKRIEGLIVEPRPGRERISRARDPQGVGLRILLEDGPKGTTWKVKETP